MAFFTTPTSFRLANGINGVASVASRSFTARAFDGFQQQSVVMSHETHPDLGRLIILVFSAVLEVVCVSVPGYIIARQGMFNAEQQKFAANLNVMLFTPCLIFTKLASQLTADTLADLAVIPAIFALQTLVSYLVSIGVSRAFGLAKRPANFVTAMGVFGNSNSLPISLVISLSQTLNGLHWDRIPGDNDDEVSARGILYLLIFQQLGQLVRWSWGYHVLLAPTERPEIVDAEAAEEGRYRDDDEGDLLIPGLDGDDSDTDAYKDTLRQSHSSTSFESGGITPVTNTHYILPDDEYDDDARKRAKSTSAAAEVDSILHAEQLSNSLTSFPTVRAQRIRDEYDIPDGIRGWVKVAGLQTKRSACFVSSKINAAFRGLFNALPYPIQRLLSALYRGVARFGNGLWEFMNPPLWAMLLAGTVATIPSLQRLFFQEDSFVANSVTRAITQSGGVAVPLILVVLGANLARNTLPQTALEQDSEENKIGTKLLVASLVSRMLLPTLIMAPFLALMAKYLPISIVDDPIFIIVCFLLTGAPSALQLAQICQINGVYENVMSKILFQSYVIWILPSTLMLVMCALEVVEWARPISRDIKDDNPDTKQPFPGRNVPLTLLVLVSYRNAAPPQDADRKSGDGSQDGQRPLRPAMVMAIRGDDGGVSPKSGPTKVVSIEEPKLSPPMQPLDTPPIKQFPAGVGKRLTGRPTPSVSNSSKISLVSQASLEDFPRQAMSQSGESSSGTGGGGQYNARHKHQHDKLLSQVSEWLHVQKAKKAARKARKHKSHPREEGNGIENVRPPIRRESQDSCLSTISLEDLQSILEDSKVKSGSRHGPESPTLRPRRPSYSSRKYTSRRYSVTASSDTEYFDGDVIVPSCDVVLDNSKTLNYASGATTPTTSGRRVDKEAQVWVTFKSEILRLAHTLRLKGWRRVPLDSGADLEVERLSGALTNAVYVVSPPDLPTEMSSKSKARPSKLLLRIYGPQVEHLIDRDAELGILSRLARKKIGPRLLGTFRNGRFEEYFMSTTLTPKDLRDPETSKQIAKRMRELHDGIELLETERDDGPFVWRNWDKWVERCEHVISFLDTHPESGGEGRKVPAWRERGLVCGVEWSVFREMVDRYRAWLNERYGGVAGLREKLVFAHNDTQYGNILRLLPTTESPLLLPANTHKQLVVIDFEYASANTPGLEFANHFTEWCYNYHDPTTPYVCNTKSFPTPSEQRRFIRAYLNHRPQFSGSASASATPKVVPSPGPGNAGISAFMLDSRGPAGGQAAPGGYAEEEARRIAEVERTVEEIMVEARWWRVANSAQWVAWGIVQANIPELEEYDAACRTPSASAPGGEVEEMEKLDLED
ncbi:hypothetical protein V493_06241, partial [Pseudogymnoascus sp. VKM F-4281 (FW-2241)]